MTINTLSPDRSLVVDPSSVVRSGGQFTVHRYISCVRMESGATIPDWSGKKAVLFLPDWSGKK